MFTHLHIHTEYSLLDGMSRIPQLVQQAKSLGMDSLAITDHGALYGVVEFYSKAKEAGINPILGCELYVAQGARHSKTPADKSPYHLTVLARNNIGYRNLVQLSSLAQLEGFYYKPRVDKELLAQHAEGLIVLSGCPTAEIPRLILEGDLAQAEQAVQWYQETFGEDNFFLEIQRHPNLPELATLNPGLLTISHKVGVPLVATNDCHYVHEDQASLQDILICIHTNTNITDDTRLKMSDSSYFLKSSQEMEELFSDLPEALENTQIIAERCRVELDFSTLHLPEYLPPKGLSADDYLDNLCWEGAAKRFGDSLAKVVVDRLSYELDVIRQTRFSNYFLVVWDISEFVHKENILFGVRGSAASSLVLYCLGVTDIDPLQYGLVFERFLNPERKELPDIDMDFQDDRRDEVIAYVVQKYGQDRVAQIITFGTLGTRAAIRDVGRALALPYADVDQVARLVPPRAQSLDEALETSLEFREMAEGDLTLRRLIDIAKQLEGTVRHASTHAAGVVISKEPLTEYIPLQRPVKGVGTIAMTQFPMDPIAKLGLLKMDFLGLSNLTILAKVLRMIQHYQGISLDLKTIPLDDAKTFDLLGTGETTSLFQMEGTGMRHYIKELKPTSLAEVAAMIALYRPGPMEHIDSYIAAKHGRATIHYAHEDLRDILEETYGVIVYQDQVLHITRKLAGYSLGEADVVRKAMGKKIPVIMQQERDKFLEGARNRGYSKKLAEEVFSLLEPFAGYAFNKAHSISYALIAYWTAYFKANYPTEYMCSVLNANMGNTDKMATIIQDCRRVEMDIPILPPDVNHSEAEFIIEVTDEGKPAIRFGIAAVKNVGFSAVGPILDVRQQGGAFPSLEDFCRRVGGLSLHRRPLESLIKVGVFDSMGSNRGTLLASIDRLLSLMQKEARLRDSGQATMFDLFGDTVPTPLESLSLPQAEVTAREKLTWERELLGVYLSDNPFNGLVPGHPESMKTFRRELEMEPNRRVVLGGQVSSVELRQTRQGKPFLIATLQLLDGGIDVFVWTEQYRATKELWEEGAFLWVVGKTRVRDDQLSISCDEAKPYYSPTDEQIGEKETSALQPPQLTSTNGIAPRRIVLYMQESPQPQQDEERLRQALKIVLDFPGEEPIEVVVATGHKRIRLAYDFTTSYGPELETRLDELLGQGAVEVVEAQE